MAKQKWKLSLKMPRKYDFWLHLSSLVMILFGSLMILSTSVGSTSQSDTLVVARVVFKQTVFVIIGYFMMIFLANNFTMLRVRKLGKLIGIVLMVACLSTLAFTAAGGSRAWIRLGPISLQPSEFVKVFMVVMIAVSIEVAGRRNFDWWTMIKTPFLFLCAFGLILILQRDLGTLVVIGMLSIISFLIPSHKNLRKIQRLVKIGLTVGCVGVLFLMTPPGLELVSKIPVFSHVGIRFANAVNPFLDPYGVGYQNVQGLVGIAAGGLMGKGIGQSQQKFGFLTQADNDFILAIVIEELGIFGLALIVIGYSIIIQRLFHYAYRTKSEGYKIILIGTAMYIFLHFFLNVGGVGGLIPLTGVPLLFISSGGSALMSIMCAIGIAQAIIAKIRRQGE